MIEHWSQLNQSVHYVTHCDWVWITDKSNQGYTLTMFKSFKSSVQCS